MLNHPAFTGAVITKEDMTSYGAKVSGLKKAHLELYKYMKKRYENNENFNKEDLLRIYNSYVTSTKRLAGSRALTEEQGYNNASTWLNRAISILVRRGYLGLTFRKNNGHKQEGILCQIGQ